MLVKVENVGIWKETIVVCFTVTTVAWRDMGRPDESVAVTGNLHAFLTGQFPSIF
jgi:hypothetical protein